MSRTTKIEKARAIFGRAYTQYRLKDGKLVAAEKPAKPHKKVKLIKIREGERNIYEGGIRYGNKRKAVAKEKISKRRAERRTARRPEL